MPKTRERLDHIEFSYFFEGDYVRGPGGVAKVAIDEELIRSEKSYLGSEVFIRYKDNTSEKVSRLKLERISAGEYFRIDKNECPYPKCKHGSFVTGSHPCKNGCCENNS